MHGVNGLLVQPFDPAALASAMEQLGNDAAMRVRMGCASSTRVQEIYAVEKVNAAMMQIMGISAV